MKPIDQLSFVFHKFKEESIKNFQNIALFLEMETEEISIEGSIQSLQGYLLKNMKHAFIRMTQYSEEPVRLEMAFSENLSREDIYSIWGEPDQVFNIVYEDSVFTNITYIDSWGERIITYDPKQNRVIQTIISPHPQPIDLSDKRVGFSMKEDNYHA